MIKNKLGINNKINVLNSFFWLHLNEYLFYYDNIITIFQACLQKGIYIPRFCYHIKLKLAGNCRLCFVEDSETLKPIISCSTLILDEIEIFTHTQLVFEARESVLEFLLINHPLDCPVCDQGGECDLQDQFMTFGGIVSRYYEKLKKNVLDKNLSNSIKLSLNKCINCSRCTRYSQDILSSYSFSLLGRGSILEISNYSDFFLFKNEFSGNVIDLCPVGAITSKFYSYINRYWELIDFKFIDIFDVFNTFIRIDFTGYSLIRIIPLENEYLNEEWISDKCRFNFDGFFKFRLLKCFLIINNFYINLSWNNVLYYIKNYFIKILNFFFIKKKTFFYNKVFLSSILSDFYLLNFIKYNLNKINFNNIFLNNNFTKNFRKNFYFLMEDADFINDENFLFLGINLRFEYPILNVKLREKASLDYSLIYLIGFTSNLNYFFIHLNNNFNFFLNFFYNLNNVIKINLFIGYSFLKLNNSLLSFYNYIYEKIYCLNLKIFNLFCFKNLLLLNNEINVSSFLNIKFLNKYYNYFSLNYSFSSLHLKKNINLFNKKLMSIYQGSNNNSLVDQYSVILSSKLFFEKSFIYINIIGIFMDYTYLFYKFFMNNLKSDLKILKNFFDLLNLNIKNEIFYFKFFFFNKNYKMQNFKVIILNNLFYFNNIILYKLFNIGFNSLINNFYLNDIISLCSNCMIIKNFNEKLKNDYNFFFINKLIKWLF